MYEHDDTYEYCMKDGRCVDLHSAHSDFDDQAFKAARLLLCAEETLVVTAALIRAKYLITEGTPLERARGIYEATRRKRSAPEYLNEEYRMLATEEGQKRIARSLDPRVVVDGYGVFKVSDDTLVELGENAIDLVTRWDPRAISEGSPLNVSEETAYTVNQGESMVYCLRNRSNPETFVSRKLLNFVAIHELAHVFTESFEHPPRYWEHFKWLLNEMEEAGLYTSDDYARRPEYYCGLKVNHNPMYDPSVPDIRKLPVDEWGPE